jgi:HSP20 family protein
MSSKKKPERPRTVTIAMVKSAHVSGIQRMELEKLRDRVERLYFALREVADMDALPALGTFALPIDVYETVDAFVIHVELPGVTREQININLTNSQLHIFGEKRHSSRQKVVSHFCSERNYGRFERVVTLHWAINMNDATAEFSNGLLIVRLPKQKDRRGTAFKVPIEEKE